MLKIKTPNGKVLTFPDDKLSEIVLELCGGCYTEKSTRDAMLAADKLRNTGHIAINGYDLNLIGEEP